MIEQQWIQPNWPAPSSVKAWTTTRYGGVSAEPYASFNVANHIGDKPSSVIENRKRLKEVLKLSSSPFYLQQIHGSEVVIVNSECTEPEADASITREKNLPCIVLTADCLPILIAHKKAECVAAIHGGWKSLAANIIAESIKKLAVDPDQLMVWLGPAIGPCHFEVGQDVYDIFVTRAENTKQRNLISSAFLTNKNNPGHYFLDLYQIAKFQLSQCGVKDIYGGELCTYCDEVRFYSYRRDHITGRMASLVWIE